MRLFPFSLLLFGLALAGVESPAFADGSDGGGPPGDGGGGDGADNAPPAAGPPVAPPPVSPTFNPSPMGGGDGETGKPIDPKKIDSDVATEKSVTAEKSGSSKTAARGKENETVRARVAKLREEGDEALAGGVAHLAAGITRLSMAEEDRAEQGLTPLVKKEREEALQQIHLGGNAVAKAKKIAAHANAIAMNENKLASVGGASLPIAIRPAEFDLKRLSEEGLGAIEALESQTGITAAHLAEVVNSGGREELVHLVSTAKGMGMPEKELLAAIPSFEASSAGFPTTPAQISEGSAARILESVPSQAGRDIRITASEHRNSESFGKRESIQPLDKDSLFSGSSSLTPAGTFSFASGSAAELGDPDKDLFQRVRRVFKSRSAELLKR